MIHPPWLRQMRKRLQEFEFNPSRGVRVNPQASNGKPSITFTAFVMQSNLFCLTTLKYDIFPPDSIAIYFMVFMAD